MAHINDALDLDAISAKNSPIHNLDGRIKLISFILIILFAVLSDQLFVQIILEIFLLIVLYIATLSFKSSFARLALLLPFGGAIIIFQPFIHPGKIIWASGISWINITDTGLNWAAILLSRLIVSLLFFLARGIILIFFQRFLYIYIYRKWWELLETSPFPKSLNLLRLLAAASVVAPSSRELSRSRP